MQLVVLTSTISLLLCFLNLLGYNSYPPQLAQQLNFVNCILKYLDGIGTLDLKIRVKEIIALKCILIQLHYNNWDNSFQHFISLLNSLKKPNTPVNQDTRK